MVYGELQDVLDHDDALACRDLLQHRGQQGGLACARSAGDQERHAGRDHRPQHLTNGRAEGAPIVQCIEVQGLRCGQPQGDDRAAGGQGREDRVETDAGREVRIGPGHGVVEPSTSGGGQPDCQIAGLARVQPQITANQARATVQPHLTVVVDQHVGDARCQQ